MTGKNERLGNHEVEGIEWLKAIVKNEHDCPVSN